jgi:hypothetical protein
MADANIDVQWDQSALEVWLTSVSEEMLPDMAEEVATAARALAPVRTKKVAYHGRVRSHQGGAGGALKASVVTSTDRDYEGPFADIAALWYGRFLDPKARQLHALRPFLPTALISTLDGRDFYLG